MCSNVTCMSVIFPIEWDMVNIENGMVDYGRKNSCSETFVFTWVTGLISFMFNHGY